MSFLRRLAPLSSFVSVCAAATLPGCLLDWEEKDTVVQECPPSSSCNFDCTDVERCLVECGSASSCSVACSNTEDCIVECGLGADCNVACQDAGGCSLDCDSGASGTCEGSCIITSSGTASCE